MNLPLFLWLLSAASLVTTPSLAIPALQQPQTQDSLRVEITTPAPFGTGGEYPRAELAGRATGPRVTEYKIVIYSLTDQWYVQPYAASPLTDIAADGAWRANIALGKTYAALLVKPSYAAKATVTQLPKPGGDILAVHSADAKRDGDVVAKKDHVLTFSGLDWRVKTSDAPVGPGPNHFRKDNVFVDSSGKLHLRITRHENRWYCAEVVSVRSFGYGTYRYFLELDAADLDPNAVLGCFTWNDDPAFHHREIDVEISRWTKATNDNAQFVVQPHQVPQNILRFNLPKGTDASIHSFVWSPTTILFESLRGRQLLPPDEALVIRRHKVTSGVPEAGGENARINLWLFAGTPPSHGKDVAVVISKFVFEPLPAVGEAARLEITEPAPIGTGGEYPRAEIAGRATGPRVTDYKVVIYAFTDQWYVQPYAASALTDIAPDGTWRVNIALGKTYAALLVRPGYTPKTILTQLPKPGGDVLAVHTADARR